MVRKYYRKRYYYRKGKALKKSSIFGNKSAKGQARQIYALNKKVNYIQKRNAPEIIKNIGVLCNYSSTVPTTNLHLNFYKDRLFHIDYGKYTMVSDVIRPHSIKFSGIIGLCPQSMMIKSDPDSDDYEYLDNANSTVYYRILMGFCKSGAQPILNPIENIAGGTALDAGFHNMSVINGPLKEHFTQNLWLVKQKIMHVDKYHPTKSFVIKLNSKKLMNYQKSINNIVGDNNLGKGELCIWIQTLNPTWNNTYTHIAERAPETYCHIDYSISFVDNK